MPHRSFHAASQFGRLPPMRGCVKWKVSLLIVRWFKQIWIYFANVRGLRTIYVVGERPRLLALVNFHKRARLPWPDLPSTQAGFSHPPPFRLLY